MANEKSKSKSKLWIDAEARAGQPNDVRLNEPFVRGINETKGKEWCSQWGEGTMAFPVTDAAIRHLGDDHLLISPENIDVFLGYCLERGLKVSLGAPYEPDVSDMPRALSYWHPPSRGIVLASEIAQAAWHNMLLEFFLVCFDRLLQQYPDAFKKAVGSVDSIRVLKSKTDWDIIALYNRVCILQFHMIRMGSSNDPSYHVLNAIKKCLSLWYAPIRKSHGKGNYSWQMASDCILAAMSAMANESPETQARATRELRNWTNAQFWRLYRIAHAELLQRSER